MSKPHYGWWSYVKDMIRKYPERREAVEKSDEKAFQMKEGGGELHYSRVLKKEYEAVEQAVKTTVAYQDGDDRLRVIRLVFWDQSHTIDGAALKVCCSERTAQEWHRKFIRLVAENYGLLD